LKKEWMLDVVKNFIINLKLQS